MHLLLAWQTNAVDFSFVVGLCAVCTWNKICIQHDMLFICRRGPSHQFIPPVLNRGDDADGLQRLVTSDVIVTIL